MPLQELMDMPPAMFMRIQMHYSRHPQGDARTHFLLAKLLCAVKNMWLKEGDKPFTLYDEAPWLDTPEVQKARALWEAEEDLRIMREGARAVLKGRDAD